MSTIPPLLTHFPLPATSATLTVGDAVRAEFTAYESDWYKLELDKGSTYLFAVRGALDGGGTLTWNWAASSLTLLDATGKILDTVHENPASGRAAIPFVPAAGGTYYLRAYGFTLGSYTMAASETPVDDLLAGTLDGSHINGGAGLDTVVYAGLLPDYSVARSGADVRLTAAAGGSATLANIERVQFAGADGLALDVNGSAGAAYRLYQAAFDRAPDKAGVGFWMHEMDHGMPLALVAQHFVMSAEFAALYGGTLSNADFVTRLYANIFDRAPDAGGFAFWVNALNDHYARADVLASFSESAEHAGAVAQLIGAGFAYTPYGI